MTKIIRRPDFAGGGITPEEKTKLDEHAQLWINRIMKTGETDKRALTEAIKGLYRVSGLAEPRVIIVPSPLVAAVAGSLSAGILYLRDKARAATYDATRVSTNAATYDAKYKNKGWCEKIATSFSPNNSLFLMECVKKWYRLYQGGNMWGQYDSYLTAARDILGLKLGSHDKYQYWEQAAIHGGYRMMHEKFCIVSEFPVTLKVDEENRPHCENGPSHEWKDGWKLYHWHGVKIPDEWIEAPKTLTPEIALNWIDVEQRRAACEILGWHNVLDHPSLNPKIINEDAPNIGTLIQVDLPDAPKQWFLKYQCGTGRWFAESVNDKSFDTALKANAGGNGWRGNGDPMSFIPFIRT